MPVMNASLAARTALRRRRGERQHPDLGGDELRSVYRSPAPFGSTARSGGGGAVGAGARGFPQPHRQRCLAVLDRIEKGVQSRESEKRGRNSFGCGSCSYSHRNRQQHTLGNFRFRSQLGYTRSFSGNRWHFLNFIPRMEGARDYSKMSSEPTPAPKLTSRNIKDRVTRH